MLAWELVGAVVGAGMASGREIASFFTQYGGWGMVGILLSVGVLVWLSDVRHPAPWHGRWPERLWQLLQTLLLIATGGAMLSGSGEVAALTLPIRGAKWMGMAFTAFLAWLLAKKTVSGLAWVSRALLAVLAVLIALGFAVPPIQGVPLQEAAPQMGLLRGLAYGGFNAALQAPIMARATETLNRRRKQSAWLASGIILCLLMLGNAVLLRHPALIGESMPFLMLMRRFGKLGYSLGAVSLYLAVLSTLMACLRGLPGNLLPMAGIVLVSVLGFTGVVEIAYPLLGAGCFLMLAIAKVQGSLAW